MPSWTHLIRFVGVEDRQSYLGQLVDTTRDVGKDTREGVEVKAYLTNRLSVKRSWKRDGDADKTQLLSPISREECNFIRCLGLNYRDHAQEANLLLPKAPVLFAKPRAALADPYPAAINIVKCAQDGTSDHEAELCVVVGKTGRDISEEDAVDYVLGYTASNDVSARTLQMVTTQRGFSKGLRRQLSVGTGPGGSKVLTRTPQQLSIKAIYNGTVVQDGNTKDMIFKEADTIFLTSTPAGIGCFRQPPVVLEDSGDIRVEVEQIGTLVNEVRYDVLQDSGVQSK